MSRASVQDHLKCRPQSCSIRRSWVRLLALVIVVFYVIPISQAQDSRPTEYQVKAAYLYNFGKFVDWSAAGPAVKDDSFAICVLGQDPFGPALDDALAKQSIDGKNAVARRITKLQEALTCRILFISGSQEGQLKEILATLEKSSVLTVSDISQFTQRGGMIQFVVEGNKVRFEVNIASAERAGLILSSQLLKVATKVRRGSQPGD